MPTARPVMVNKWIIAMEISSHPTRGGWIRQLLARGMGRTRKNRLVSSGDPAASSTPPSRPSPTDWKLRSCRGVEWVMDPWFVSHFAFFAHVHSHLTLGTDRPLIHRKQHGVTPLFSRAHSNADHSSRTFLRSCRLKPQSDTAHTRNIACHISA